MKQIQWKAATVAVSALGCLTAACARGPKPLSEYTAGLRYGEECAAARAEARAQAAESLPEGERPQPRELWIPPLPPTELQGTLVKISLLVDSSGTVTKNGVKVEGIRDANYAARIRTTAAKIQFRPAVLRGCAVAGTAVINYTF